MRTALAAAIGAIITITAPAFADEVRIIGTARVLDGDTVSLGAVRVRLHGIDAPEGGQTCKRSAGQEWDCGTEATNRLAELVAGREIECSVADRDRYGRLVAACYVEGINVNEVLVREGLAWAYRRYSSDYIADEAAAKAASIGIWADKKAMAPWDYRATKRKAGDATQ